jgi:hypothetical protein
MMAEARIMSINQWATDSPFKGILAEFRILSLHTKKGATKAPSRSPDRRSIPICG